MRTTLSTVALLAVACRPAVGPSPGDIANATAPRPPTLRDLDWNNRTYDTAAPGLTPQPRRFVAGVFDNRRGDRDDREVFRVAPPIYLDVTGDGVDEALVELVSDQTVFAAPSLVHVMVFAGDARRQTVLGFVYLVDCRLGDATMVDGTLELRAAASGGDGAPCEDPGGATRWRWNGAALIELPGSGTPIE